MGGMGRFWLVIGLHHVGKSGLREETDLLPIIRIFAQTARTNGQPATLPMRKQPGKARAFVSERRIPNR
jgi:hypothetical protein